jgi:hypothetical protein
MSSYLTSTFEEFVCSVVAVEVVAEVEVSWAALEFSSEDVVVEAALDLRNSARRSNMTVFSGSGTGLPISARSFNMLMSISTGIIKVGVMKVNVDVDVDVNVDVDVD